MKNQTKLKIGLGISIVTVLVNDMLCAEISERFGFEDKLGQILSNLGLAFIASYIFYWLVVLAKDKIDRENNNHFLYPMTKELVYYSYQIFEDIISFSNSTVNNITRNEFVECCKKINPNDKKPNHQYGEPGGSIPMTYGLWIYLKVKQITVLADTLFSMPFLAPEYRKTIFKLTDSATVKFSRHQQDIPETQNLLPQAVILYELLEAIRELDVFKKEMEIEYTKKINSNNSLLGPSILKKCSK